MSRYKEQIKANLKTIDLTGDYILSIGKHKDDRDYFASVKCDHWLTMDIDRELAPDFLFNMNSLLQTETGFEIEDKYVGMFNVVLALNLFEYIFDPITAHRNLLDLLAPGGTLIATYPFVYPVHEPSGTDYLRYTPEGAEKILKITGFEVLDNVPLFGGYLLPEFYMVEGMKARAEVDHKIIGSLITARKS